MGVYIKGVEMPKSCGNCFYDTRCDNWRLRNWGAPPPDDCPLVPVPPHGRLIDADALIEKVIAKYLEHERKGEFVFAAAEIKQDIVDLISNAPTIIEAEEGETCILM